MRIFDPHIHMSSRTTDDYEAMFAAGVRAVVEPSFWLGQPRTNAASFINYFDGLIGWERFRASQFGIRHHCTIGLNPKEANDPRCREVLSRLDRYLEKDGVVAVGETGYDSMTEAEDDVFRAHLRLGVDHGLPVLVHTPHRDKLEGTRRSLEVLSEEGIDPGLVLIDHLNEVTVDLVADSGSWMGFSLYPDTKMDEERMVAIIERIGVERVLINSAADWGRSDPLTVARTARLLANHGFDERTIETLVWDNPVSFYGQSGRLNLEPVPGFDVISPPTETFEGNSVLRGTPANRLVAR